MTEQTIAKRILADRIAANLNLPQGQTLQIIQAFLDEIVNELGNGNRLEFRDFGVFELVSRKPRTALNPKTLEKVPVARRTVVKFRAGRMVKAKVKDLEVDADGNPLPGSPTPPTGA
jgi:integration host factor subunit beta